MLDYHDVFNKLAPQFRMGHFAVLSYESSEIIESWKSVQAESIFEWVVSNDDSIVRSWIDKYAIDRNHCIEGVDFWLELRRYAENISKEICARWLTRDGLSIDDLPISDNDVDFAISDESESDEHLSDIKSNDPLLYGEICFEVERITNGLVAREMSLN